MKQVITISREFGSGGRSIGREVAERLGWAFYDRALVERLAKESGYSEEFIEKRGEGLHHIALRVENIEETLKNLKEQGVRLIDETPRYGAGGAKIAFVHPKSSGGVLLEISQREETKA